MTQAPRVLLIGKRIGQWVSLREVSLRPCGCSQELKGLRYVVSESVTTRELALYFCCRASRDGLISCWATRPKERCSTTPLGQRC